ncbi:MAG: ribosomal protein S18-alanine N-acetyltransferase [Gemmatimonadaceae bacterium]|nr:ribosomal protein S18-alanine N-acetyltransferase [Gemmatimonadaceae bacterium]
MKAAELVGPITLRPADASDVVTMAAIERDAFSDPWPVSAFTELLSQPYARLTVAVDARNALCGYCVLLHVLDEGEIANIAVAPWLRRRGIAAQLLDAALASGAALGLATVFLEVRLSNDAARGLYASRGFEPVGRRRAYYRDPLEDALVLRWERPTSA